MHEDSSSKEGTAIDNDTIEQVEAAAERMKWKRIVSTTPANKKDEWTGLYIHVAVAATVGLFRRSRGQRHIWLLGQHLHFAATIHKEYKTLFYGHFSKGNPRVAFQLGKLLLSSQKKTAITHSE